MSNIVYFIMLFCLRLRNLVEKEGGYYTSRIPVSMTNEDIDYSTPGTLGCGPFKRIPRREYRDPIYIDDIPGAKSNNAYRSTIT